jgi:ribosomal RNA assembly protein
LIALEYVRIPLERVGVLIGKDGTVKKSIEESTGTRIDLDSRTGEITIEQVEETGDPLAAWVARDIVTAIGRGFSPERASRLLEEDQMLRVTDLTSELGKSEKALHRQKSRLIGRRGRTRSIIEETTRTDISIMGKTVSIIGDDEQVAIAYEAVEMIVRGIPHKIVYKFLEKKSRELREREKEIWQEA